MKTEYVRIYSEDELQRMVKQAVALLRKVGKDVLADERYGDFEALHKIWVRYETTRYIVTESAFDEGLLGEEYRTYPESLFIEREVEDNYSDELKNPNALHNGIVDLQFLYNTIQSNLLTRTFAVKYEGDNRIIVIEIAADVMRHFNRDNFNRQKVVDILEHLNYKYLNNQGLDKVSYDDVLRHAIANKFRQEDMIEKLKTTLGLVEEK